MRVLAVDPGYSNLGLAVVEIERAGGFRCVREVFHSRNVKVGNAVRPIAFAANVVRELDDLERRYGKFDAVALETPTFIQKQLRTTALIWHTIGAVLAWAAVRDLPPRWLSPMQLKRVAAGLLGREWDPKKAASKREVKEAVNQAFKEEDHRKFESSHEADAVLAAIGCWGVLGSSDAP